MKRTLEEQQIERVAKQLNKLNDPEWSMGTECIRLAGMIEHIWEFHGWWTPKAPSQEKP